MHHHH